MTKIILPKDYFIELNYIAAPTILLQLIITIDLIKHKIQRALVAQLKTIEEVYQNDKI